MCCTVAHLLVVRLLHCMLVSMQEVQYCSLTFRYVWLFETSPSTLHWSWSIPWLRIDVRVSHELSHKVTEEVVHISSVADGPQCLRNAQLCSARFVLSLPHLVCCNRKWRRVLLCLPKDCVGTYPFHVIIYGQALLQTILFNHSKPCNLFFFQHMSVRDFH